jgi:hypothetical protein
MGIAERWMDGKDGSQLKLKLAPERFDHYIYQHPNNRDSNWLYLDARKQIQSRKDSRCETSI